MQVLRVERNGIDKKISNVSVEDVGSANEVLVVRIRPNVYSQLQRPFLRSYLALPITQHAGREFVENFPWADNIDRLRAAADDEGNRYLAVTRWNQFFGRHR